MKTYYILWESKKGNRLSMEGSRHRSHVIARTLDSAVNRIKRQYGKVQILDHKIGRENNDLKAGIYHTE